MPPTEVFENVHMEWHNALFYFTRHTGCFSSPPQPRSIMLTAREHAKLCKIIHTTVASFYNGHDFTLSAKAVLEQYRKFLAWRDRLPEEVADADGESQPLPHVLYLQ